MVTIAEQVIDRMEHGEMDLELDLEFQRAYFRFTNVISGFIH